MIIVTVEYGFEFLPPFSPSFLSLFLIPLSYPSFLSLFPIPLSSPSFLFLLSLPPSSPSFLSLLPLPLSSPSVLLSPSSLLLPSSLSLPLPLHLSEIFSDLTQHPFPPTSQSCWYWYHHCRCRYAADLVAMQRWKHGPSPCCFGRIRRCPLLSPECCWNTTIANWALVWQEFRRKDTQRPGELTNDEGSDEVL
mgnify:CR=1 FL=1